MSKVGGSNSGRRVSVTARSIWRNAERLPKDQSQKLERERSSGNNREIHRLDWRCVLSIAPVLSLHGEARSVRLLRSV